VIKLRYGKTRGSDLVFQGALPGIKFALGENVTRKRGQTQTNPERFPTTRQGVEYVIRDAFTRAKAYRKEWQDYDTKKKAGQDVLAPRRDLQLDALVEVLEGKRLVHAHSYRADEILMLHPPRRRDGLQDRDVPARPRRLCGWRKKLPLTTPAHRRFPIGGATRWRRLTPILHNASLMTHKGVLVSINWTTPSRRAG
jgi:hypothetical protein